MFGAQLDQAFEAVKERRPQNQLNPGKIVRPGWMTALMRFFAPG
jgi:hypothetical protein